MLAETSEPEGDWDAVEAEAVDLRMPAWLMSALAHGLVILALPLFDLPPFAHRQPVTLEVTSLAADQTGDVAITQVVLSMTLPDAPVATLAEKFAAKAPSPTAGGGSMPHELVIDSEATAPTAVCELRPISAIELGPNDFDPAGTRDVMAARSDLLLQVPDQRHSQTPLVSPEDLTGSVASSPENEAIAAALRWIVSQQRNNGSWDQLAGMIRTGRGHEGESRHVGATALALLPLIALGQTHRTGKYPTQMQTAVEFLLTPDDGAVGRDAEAQRALALCELFLATRDPRVREAAANSIECVLKVNYKPHVFQDLGPEYSYDRRMRIGVISGTPRPRRPASVTPEQSAWTIWAAYAGQLAGLQDNTNVLPTLRGNCAFSGEDALVARAYSTFDGRDSLLVAAADQIAAAGSAKRGERSREADYLATLLLRRLKHPLAKQFQEELTNHLLKQQLKIGPSFGSWKPEHSRDTPLTATIFSALILAAPSETTAIHQPRTTVP